MLPVFLVLAPGFLAAVLHRSLRQKPLSNFDFVVYAVIYAFFIAAFAFGVIYLRGFGDLAPLSVFGNASQRREILRDERGMRGCSAERAVTCVACSGKGQAR